MIKKKFAFMMFVISLIVICFVHYSEAQEKASNTVTSPTLGAKFVLIPAGTFMMGSPNDEPGRKGDESPQHQVTISNSFYMQTTEVTQGQWKLVMGNNPSHFSSCGDDCPVEKVSWNDVHTFISKLNRKEGKGKYRLPTEAEWEYAARAGSTTAFANGVISKTDCSNDPNLDRMGWYCGNAMRKTHPVAQKSPNAWGLYDMHGNVWEWVKDWKGNYPTDSVINPSGPARGSDRVSRGGSLFSVANYCRSAKREQGFPGLRNLFLGFRLVRTS